MARHVVAGLWCGRSPGADRCSAGRDRPVIVAPAVGFIGQLRSLALPRLGLSGDNIKSVNGTLNLTRVCNDRQFESDPPGLVAVFPASGKNGGQTLSPSLVFAFAVCGLAVMPARRLSLSR
jgi:hypothetical protein